MTIDFQHVRDQIKTLGEKAIQRATELKDLRQQAFDLLERHASNADFLLERVRQVTQLYDPNLRCAIPARSPDGPAEPLNQHTSLPALPPQATLLAADGSQIYPDRHSQADYCLINVGAIQARLGSAEAPQVTVNSRLIFDDDLYTESGGVLSEAQVALMRDLNERKRLAELAGEASPPVITFTDGPMELWGGRDSQEKGEYEKKLKEYQDVLRGLCKMGVTTAGYVDKPSANLVVRLLDIASLEEKDLPRVKENRPLRRVSDRAIFQDILQPGERSAVFAMQSPSAHLYEGDLSLHFFYLNAGRQNHPWLARVEIPAWVAGDPKQLDNLHAALYYQCQILGSRPFPYLIHRAHEAAVVSMEEKSQVTAMIVAELYKRGAPVDEASYKQSAKDAPARARYER